MTKAQKLSLVGGLSKPSKMPGYGWSIDARLCKKGAKLRLIPGSVCASCYALKGRYVFPAVRAAMERRLDAYNANPDEWVVNMVEAIKATNTEYFRWFDSGDLQSVDMLDNIAKVCHATPEVKHWLPTREAGMVSEYFKTDRDHPTNLNIRISAPMVGAEYKGKIASCHAVTTSSVVANGATCPAPKQDNKCGGCRACWDRNVQNVSYSKH